MNEFAFIDMDGVIADFVSGVCVAHGRSNPYENTPDALGNFEMHEIWGISSNAFWKPCDGESFWDDLGKTPEAEEIVRVVCGVFGTNNCAILTSPSMSPYCVPGKRRWMRRHFPALQDSMIFTGAKKFIAGPGRWLIDDKDANVEAFRAAGGQAITVPRPWNSEHSKSHQVMAQIRKELCAD